MKRMFSLVVMAVIAFAASAEDYHYLTFRTLDGTEQSLPIAEGINIAFQDGQIVATAGDGSIFQHVLTDMQDMWFSTIATSIDAARTDNTDSTPVCIYSADGRVVNANGNNLPAGIYIIKTENQTIKRIIK